MQYLQEDIIKRWFDLEIKMFEKFGKKPDVESVLFLIGIQEVQTIKKDFTKEEKQDLIHIAICIILLPSKYYILENYDDDGWPHFKQIKELPTFINLQEQEYFLKDHILLYFNNQK